MSSIASVGGANGAWADMSSSRASAMKERMFAKADADGSGGVDKAELQTLFDKIAKKAGTTAANAQTQLSKMDSDGDGSLSKDELDSGMKSLMPPPESTVDFAQQRAADKDAAVSDLFSKLDADGSGSLDATELKSLTDKLAADGPDAFGSDRRVSAEADAAVFKALDSDGDGVIGKNELGTAVTGQGDGHQMRPNGPPPGPPSGGTPGSGGGGGGGASSSSANDPLDTNEDGVVSAQERAAGAMKELVQTLITAMDSDGDRSISKTEVADFKAQMESAFSGRSSAASSSSEATYTSSSSSSSSSSSDSASPQGGGHRDLDLKALRELVQQEYSKAAANFASTSTMSLAV